MYVIFQLIYEIVRSEVLLAVKTAILWDVALY
jgi:hypothetical protein